MRGIAEDCIADFTPRQRAWALNNAAYINLDREDFYQSFELSKRALSSADAVLAVHPKLGSEMKNLKSKAALTGAIASARLGNVPAAQQLQQLAKRWRVVVVRNKLPMHPSISCAYPAHENRDCDQILIASTTARNVSNNLAQN